MGSDTSSGRSQQNGLPQGSVLAPTLFNLNDLPVTCDQKFIFTDDICLATQSRFFSELECRLSLDLTWMLHYCQQWCLKPSPAKTVTSMFHLHNTSASRDLSVSLDGQCLRHNRYHTAHYTHRLHTVLHRTADKNCRNAEEEKQPADEAIWL